MTLEERDRVIIDNLPFVHFVINKYYPQYSDDDDIFQVGCIGLIKAAQRYDPSRGFKFSVFASRCVLNEIGMYFRNINRHSNEMSLQTMLSADNEAFTLESTIIGTSDIDIFDLEPLFKRLSPTEKEYLLLALEGFSRGQITNRMNVTKTYTSRVFNNIRKKWAIVYKVKEK